MKKMVAFLLTVVLLLTMCSIALTASALTDTDLTLSGATVSLRRDLSDDVKGTYIKDDDGYIGIPVALTCFRRSSVPALHRAILYVVGHGEARIGTDSDYDIVNDLLDAGYVVTVLDYLGNPSAIGSPLAFSAQNIMANEIDGGKYLGGETIEREHAFLLPAGCRVFENFTYYDMATMAPNGTKEYITMVWNKWYAGQKSDASGTLLRHADSFDDLYNKDGSPLNMKLRLSIVYPANPAEGVTVPVLALASSSFFYYSVNTKNRPFFANALFQGYAACIYEHEYIPMSRDDHYGHFDTCFTLANFVANHVHSAAVRCIRYLSEDLGYDSDYMMTWGFSKSSVGPAILSDPERSLSAEYQRYNGVSKSTFPVADFPEYWDYVNSGVDLTATPEEQPWQNYKNSGEPISSNVTCTYSGAGPGLCYFPEFTVHDSSVAVACSIGTVDTCDFFTAIDKVRDYLDSRSCESLYVVAEGLDHSPAFGWDSDKEVDLFDPIWQFLDNHIRAAYSTVAPEVVWTTPSTSVVYDDSNQNFEIKFSRKMNVDSVKSGVKVTRLADGKVMDLNWTVLHGDTTFRFASSQIINGSKYQIEISDACEAADGVALSQPQMETIMFSGNTMIGASEDATVKSLDADTNFGSETELEIYNDTANNDVRKSYLAFDHAGGFENVNKALLILSQTKATNAMLTLYGIENNDWNENSITWNNAPANLAAGSGFDDSKSDIISSFPLGEEITTVDVTDFLKGVSGDRVSFAMESISKSGKTLSYDFESADSSNFAIYNSISKTGQYKWGGGGCSLDYINTDAHSGTSCVYVKNVDVQGERMKLLNSFGDSKKTLTADDIGTSFLAKMYVKPDTDTKMLVSLYATDGYDAWGAKSFNLTANVWNEIEYTVTITAQMVNANANAVTLTPAPFTNFYLDDFSVQYDSGIANITSCEGADSLGLQGSTLVLYTPKVTENGSSVAAQVSSGSLKHTSNLGSTIVSGKTVAGISGTKKGYIKLPISAFDSNCKTAELKFSTATVGPAHISVYGILGDTTRFAENFDGNISWNNAFANEIDGYNVENTKVFGGAAIATVSSGTQKDFTIDVTDYVSKMKNDGYEAVTFIFVADDCDTIKKVDFEGISEYKAYTNTASLNAFDKGVCADPVNPDNQVFHFVKSGTETVVNGYSQVLSFTGLLKDNNKWETSDIGSSYVVSFRQYYRDPDNSNASLYGNIAAAGSSNYTLLSNVEDSISYNGQPANRITCNQWMDITYTFTVTSEMVSKHSDYTALLVGSGWRVKEIFVDDITVTKQVAPTVIVLGESTETHLPAAKTETFETGTTYAGASYKLATVGIDNDPVDPANHALCETKTTTSMYNASLTLDGLLKTNNIWEDSDIGNSYTITYKKYALRNDGETACGNYDGIAQKGAYTQDILKSGIQKVLTVNGSSISSCANQWYDVKITFTVTNDLVTNSPKATSILIGSGEKADKVYIDDLKVVCKVAVKENTGSNAPRLVFTDSSVVSEYGYTAAAVIDGSVPATVSVKGETLPLSKTASGDADGLSKVYYTFDKIGIHHVQKSTLKLNVAASNAGKILRVYGLNEAVTGNITWANAYANNPSDNGFNLSMVYGGAPFASITLTDEGAYDVDVTPFVADHMNDDAVSFVVAAFGSEGPTELQSASLEICYDEDESTPLSATMTGVKQNDEYSYDDFSDGVQLGLIAEYPIENVVKSAVFFLDGKQIVANVARKGDIFYVESGNLTAGKHTVKGVLTFADGNTAESESVQFSVTGFNPGDCNGSGGNPDITDLAILKKYLADPASATECINGDCNGDGNTDITDLALLKKHLAGVISVNEMKA